MALVEKFESQGNWLFKYRGQLPIILLLGGLFVHSYTVYTTKLPLNTDTWTLSCIVTGLIGLFIRIIAIGSSYKDTSGRNTEKQVAESLNIKGMYSIVRHPLYLGNYFMWLAIALLTKNIWFVLLFTTIYWIYYERIMLAEERFLIKKFGEIYHKWANETPAFFPKFNLWKKSDNPFDYKKILKREYNGMASLFLIVFIFEASEDLILEKPFNSYLWLGLFGFSLILLVTLKIIKKYTRLLEG